MIKDNINRLQSDIASICHQNNRNPDEIILVGVTKYAQTAQIKEAIEFGLVHIAENKVQAALKKFSSLQGTEKNIVRHMVGHLQSNKVKAAVQLFDMIQSVDSLKIAEEINKHCEAFNKRMDILLQVNTSLEDQKFGLQEDEVFALLDPLENLKNVRVKGLMTMAPMTEDKNRVKKSFSDLKKLFDQIGKKIKNHKSITMKYLSMGMTDDYKEAIVEGSNMVRIGRAIFKEN